MIVYIEDSEVMSHSDDVIRVNSNWASDFNRYSKLRLVQFIKPM